MEVNNVNTSSTDSVSSHNLDIDPTLKTTSKNMMPNLNWPALDSCGLQNTDSPNFQNFFNQHQNNKGSSQTVTYPRKFTRSKHAVEEAFPQNLVNRNLIPKSLLDEAYHREGEGLVCTCLLEGCNKVFKSTTGRLITNYQLRLHINNNHSGWLLSKKGMNIANAHGPNSESNNGVEQLQNYIERIKRAQIAEKEVKNEAAAVSLIDFSKIIQNSEKRKVGSDGQTDPTTSATSISPNDRNNIKWDDRPQNLLTRRASTSILSEMDQNKFREDQLIILQKATNEKLDLACSLLKGLSDNFSQLQNQTNAQSTHTTPCKKPKLDLSKHHPQPTAEQISTQNPFTDRDRLKSIHRATWITEQVCFWLEIINFSQYIDKFKGEKISGMILEYLEESDLKNLGMNTVGERVLFRYYLDALVELQG